MPFSGLRECAPAVNFSWHQKMKIVLAQMCAGQHYLCVVCSERICDIVLFVKSPICFWMVLSLQTEQSNPLLFLLSSSSIVVVWGVIQALPFAHFRFRFLRL